MILNSTESRSSAKSTTSDGSSAKRASSISSDETASSEIDLRRAYRIFRAEILPAP
jgi:hypothetical protein